MTLSFRPFPLLVVLTLASCSGPSRVEQKQQISSAAKTAEAAQDDPALLAKLTGLGAQLKKNSEGLVTEVSFRDTSVGDDDLVPIADLHHVTSLLLNDTAVTDAGMQHIAKIATLRNLDLRECAISNAGVKSLAALSELRALRLSGRNGKSTVDDGAMDELGKLTNLKVLALDYLNWISVDGIRKLTGLAELEELYLANTLVDDEALEVISTFEKLKKLRVSLNQITSDGLEHVGKMTNLLELDLSENVGIDDQGLAHLAPCTQLTKLNLWRVPITDKGVLHLAGLTNLQWLNLDNTQLTDQGLASLSGMTKLTFLHLGSTMVTNAGLVHLAALTALQDLKVTRTGVDESGVAELRKSLPTTNIQQKYIEGQ